MAVLLTEVPTRVLAVYAHPDDPEMACGGTLARWAAAGAEVRVVIATRGEKGATEPDADPAALAGVREEEVRAAGGVLGVAGIDLLGLADGEVDSSRALRGELVAIVRTHRPEVVVCPDPTAVFFGDAYVNHVDHRAIGWAAVDAVAPAAASPLYFPERGPAHQVATVLLTGTLEPDVWVDVGDALDVKIEALLRHRSQLPADAVDRLAGFVRARAEEEGRRAGTELAEAFRRLRLGAGAGDVVER